IFHRLLIKAPVETIYNALTKQEGLAGWWTPDTTAVPEVGTVATFAFGSNYLNEMKIEKLSPYSIVKWRCIKAHEEWVGTTISFELEPHQKGAVLYFYHDGWKQETAAFGSTSYDWALFLRSLKLLCETGKGLPFPDSNK